VNDVTLLLNCVMLYATIGRTFAVWKLFHTWPASCGIKTYKNEHHRSKRKLEWAKRKTQTKICNLNREMLGRLQTKLGKTKEELQKIFASL